MQHELDAEPLARDVQILGINAVGEEASNSLAIAGRDLPWLQDTAAENVWGSWEGAWRDVVILDAANEVVATYNLFTYDLSQPTNYEALKTLLRNAANAP